MREDAQVILNCLKEDRKGNIFVQMKGMEFFFISGF